MRRLPALGAAAAALGFLVLPVAAIFLRVPPSRLLHQLSSPVVTDALVVSLKTSVVAQLLIVLLGTPLAWVLASRRFRGRGLAITLVELPLVLPPAVAGIGLLAAFGRTGLLGTSIPFTQTAVVKGAKQPVLARRYIDGLVSGAGRDALQAAGFLPPP